MKMRRVMLAAPKSGSGKTVMTCALLHALRLRGEKVIAFKCGPDYIDPLFHENVLGIPSANLDTFFTDAGTTRRLLMRDAAPENIAVLEGVMGLFDGLGGIREEGSSYHLAKVTRTPVVLVVDAKGMGRSVAALLAGFVAYDTEKLIRGVILNRVSRPTYETLKPLIEEELKLKVLGFLPEREEFYLESRHLGLVLPEETEELRRRLLLTAECFCENVSVGGILALAQEAGELEEYGEAEPHGDIPAAQREAVTWGRRRLSPRIAVARDEAFCFYYQENLRLLREYGARLCFFSPMRDRGLPRECCGILLGGGYPELYAQQLGANVDMRLAVRAAAKRGMPIVAECGGFLYLHEELTDRKGNVCGMAGVLPGNCVSRGKAVRFGYVELRERQSRFLPAGEKIRGHEFHYYDCEDNGDDCIARKPVTGKEYPCVLQSENCWMGFPHLYYPSNPVFAQRFVEMAEEYGRQNSGSL